MIRWLSAIALGVCLLAATGSAHAQYRPAGFQTPSNNIFCQFFSIDGPTLRCDMMEIDVRPRPPVRCDGDWGRGFEMTARGPAERICRGDTVYDASLPVLAYGTVWQRGGFTCRSEQTGLTCFNAMQHGFSLSRARQELF